MRYVLIDVEILSDVSEVYGQGFTQPYRELENLLNNQVQSVSVGNSHIFVSGVNGKIYTWGLNDQSQTGISSLENAEF
jgi:alpha-tubulin suppressor-like RCC1 family protein